MSSITFADNKLGGRLMAAADAIAAGKLRTAAGIFMELGDELNIEAESTDGLMSDTLVLDQPLAPPEPPAPSLTMQTPVNTDTFSCSKGAHSFPQSPDSRGWFTCLACGYVVVTPPGDGSVRAPGQ